MNWDFIGTVINWAVLISGVVLAVYNLRNASTRNTFMNGVDKADTISKLNETLDVAAERNLKYEKQRKQDRDEIFLLEKRLAALESNLQYRLTFDVILGTDPSIEKANIKHLVERRENETPVNYDRRKKM